MSCHWGKILTGLPSDELQQQVITYRTKENCVLEAQLNGHRLRLTDTNPRRLAALARQLGRTRLQAITTPATPIFDGFCWANDIRSTTALKNWCIALKVLRTSSVEPVVLLPTASESQCLLRAVCAFDQGGCTSSDDQHGEEAPRLVLTQYLAYYRAERNHRGLRHQLFEPEAAVGRQTGQVIRRERPAGLLG